MNSTARDVLTMIGAGLQRGIIKSPDLEMMYSDGPKRVRLIDMVAHALESLPPPPSSADAEQIPEPPRRALTPMSAHPALAAAADYTEKCAAWEQLVFGTRAYYAALAECDAAWERIAQAVNLPPGPAHPELEESERVERLIDACEGELDGLALDHATACRIMFYVDNGRLPEAPVPGVETCGGPQQ